MFKTILTSAAIALACSTGSFAGTINAFLFEDGKDVKLTFSGSVDLSGLIFRPVVGIGQFGNVNPDGSTFAVIGSNFNTISMSVVSPSDFGMGTVTSATSVTGDTFGFGSGGRGPFVYINDAYVNNADLSGMAVFENTDIASLGADVGTFTWTFGGSVTNTAVLNVSSVAAVPLPAGGLLLVTALGGLALKRRKAKA